MKGIATEKQSILESILENVQKYNKLNCPNVTHVITKLFSLSSVQSSNPFSSNHRLLFTFK